MLLVYKVLIVLIPHLPRKKKSLFQICMKFFLLFEDDKGVKKKKRAFFSCVFHAYRFGMTCRYIFAFGELFL